MLENINRERPGALTAERQAAEPPASGVLLAAHVRAITCRVRPALHQEPLEEPPQISCDSLVLLVR